MLDSQNDERMMRLDAATPGLGLVRCGATYLGGDADNSIPYPLCSPHRKTRTALLRQSALTSIACGMFGVLTSVLARECRSVVTGRMAGALFAGEGNRSALEGPS